MSTPVPAEISEKLLGSWSLVAWTIQRDCGETMAPFTHEPQGILHYARDGTMYAFLNHPNWLDEAATEHMHFRFSAYCGGWEVSGAEVHHEVRFSSLPSTIGTRLKRFVEFRGENELSLTTDWEPWNGGAQIRHELYWLRHSRGIRQ